MSCFICTQNKFWTTGPGRDCIGCSLKDVPQSKVDANILSNIGKGYDNRIDEKCFEKPLIFEKIESIDSKIDQALSILSHKLFDI